MDINYMKIIKRHLHIMDGWPFNELYDAYKEEPKYIPLRNYKFLLVIYTAILLNCLYYLKLHINIVKLDFLKLGKIYIVIFMNAVTLQRILMPLKKSYRTTVADFVLKIHLFHYKHRSNYAMKVHKQVHKALEYFTIWNLFELYVGTASFQLIPLYNNIRSGVFSVNDHTENNDTLYDYAIYFYIPYEHNNVIYILICVISLILIFDIGSSFCIYDLLMSTIIIHVWGHLKILIHNLENFPRPEADRNKENDFRYNEEESRVIFDMLKENIEHHKLIMGFMNSVSNAFGIMMFVYYIFHQITGCILLLEISALTAEAFITYGLLTIFMYQQLIQTSFIFELIGSKSEIIKDAVYGLPWECMDVKNKKIVLFYLRNVQVPIRLNAMGLVAVGVQTAAAIIKTSLSYFIMLRTLADN